MATDVMDVRPAGGPDLGAPWDSRGTGDPSGLVLGREPHPGLPARPVGPPAALGGEAPAAGDPPEWRAFLARLEDPPVALSPAHARAVRGTWTILREALGPGLPLPRVDEGEDGGLRLSWTTDAYYAELVLLDPAECGGAEMHHWFFRDEVRDEFAGSEEPEPAPPAGRFVEMFHRALAGGG